MPRSLRLATPLLGLIVVAGVAGAQAAAHRDEAPSRAPSAGLPADAPAPVAVASPAAAPSAGPAAARATAGVRAPRDEAPRATPPAPRVESRQNKAMMIVGFAGLIAGAIIGGDPGTIIMVGGAGVGLYGLYKYLE